MTSEEWRYIQATAFGVRDSDGRLSLSRKNLRDFLPPGFPKIVTLCGSTRFKKQYEDAAKEETLAGNIVLSVGMFGHQEGIDMNGPIKEGLDVLHLRKIDMSDVIRVVSDETGYYGESTKREIYYTVSKGKIVRGVICNQPAEKS